jgi:ABC-2 type transport system ATP-binding protein
MASPPALELQGLTKAYGAKLTALSDVTLSIPPGEIFALLGPNGAGKTTLIGSVCGLVKKTSGKVRIFGRDLDEDPVGPRYQVGLVPQEVNFDPFFTVAESLYIQQGYYGQPRDEARVKEVLGALSLLGKADTITRALSGGMRRRLLIAKALVHKPRLVFLDEPTAGVDVELRRDLWTYVRKLASEGTTIVLTTHYLEEAEELADRVGVINEGRLLLVEDKKTLLRRLGEKRLIVTFSEPQGALPGALLPSGASLSADGRTLTYPEREGSTPGGDLLRALYTQGLPVANVETRSSRLEDILIEILRGKPASVLSSPTAKTQP